jgi:hypothetical protein
MMAKGERYKEPVALAARYQASALADRITGATPHEGRGNRGFVPILLQKSFCTPDRRFSGL